jgi:hypothetical protein
MYSNSFPLSEAAVYTHQVSGRPSNEPALGFCAIGKRLLSRRAAAGWLFFYIALCTSPFPFLRSNTYYQCNVYLDGDSSGGAVRRAPEEEVNSWIIHSSSGRRESQVALYNVRVCVCMRYTSPYMCEWGVCFVVILSTFLQIRLLAPHRICARPKMPTPTSTTTNCRRTKSEFCSQRCFCVCDCRNVGTCSLGPFIALQKLYIFTHMRVADCEISVRWSYTNRVKSQRKDINRLNFGYIFLVLKEKSLIWFDQRETRWKFIKL